MRNLLVLALLLCALPVGAQVNYYPATGGGSGDLVDPGSNGILARTAEGVTAARSITSSAGTIVIGNADGVAGNVTLDVDTSVYPAFSSGASDPPATCLPGERYIETDTAEAYVCIDDDPDTWQLQGTLSAAYTVIDDEDTPLTVRSTLNFEGAGVTCADDTDQTTCTIPGGSSSAFDPYTTMELYEEFAAGEAAADGRFGQNGLNFTAVNSGGGALIATDFAHGALRMNSHASNDNSGGFWAFGKVVYVPNAGDWSVDFLVKPGVNSTAITNTAMYVGLMNAPPDSAARAVWARFDSDFADATWIFQLCDAAGADGCQDSNDGADSETVASTIAPTADTAARIRIRRAASGVGGNPTIYMRVDDETEKTFCSSGCDDTAGDLPALGLQLSISYLTRTNTGVMSGAVDYIYALLPVTR